MPAGDGHLIQSLALFAEEDGGKLTGRDGGRRGLPALDAGTRGHVERPARSWWLAVCLGRPGGRGLRHQRYGRRACYIDALDGLIDSV